MQRAGLVRFTAVVADRFLAEFADLVMLRAERAVAFGALVVRFVRAALAGAVHEPMLQGRKQGSKKQENTKSYPKFADSDGGAVTCGYVSVGCRA